MDHIITKMHDNGISLLELLIVLMISTIILSITPSSLWHLPKRITAHINTLNLATQLAQNRLNATFTDQDIPITPADLPNIFSIEKPNKTMGSKPYFKNKGSNTIQNNDTQSKITFQIDINVINIKSKTQ